MWRRPTFALYIYIYKLKVRLKFARFEFAVCSTATSKNRPRLGKVGSTDIGLAHWNVYRHELLASTTNALCTRTLGGWSVMRDARSISACHPRDFPSTCNRDLNDSYSFRSSRGQIIPLMGKELERGKRKEEDRISKYFRMASRVEFEYGRQLSQLFQQIWSNVTTRYFHYQIWKKKRNVRLE